MKVALKNRIEFLMKDAGIHTFEEMAQRLTNNQNWKIGRTALSRKFRDSDITLTLKMIEAICNELQCLPGDIFETNISDISDEEINAITNKFLPFKYGNITKAALNPDEPNSNVTTIKAPNEKPIVQPEVDEEAIFGPKVTHLTIDQVKKK